MTDGTAVKPLVVLVDILDSQTARVSWKLQEDMRHLLASLELIFSPLHARYE